MLYTIAQVAGPLLSRVTRALLKLLVSFRVTGWTGRRTKKNCSAVYFETNKLKSGKRNKMPSISKDLLKAYRKRDYIDRAKFFHTLASLYFSFVCIYAHVKNQICSVFERK